MSNLSPDTSIALLQASQGQSADALNKTKNAQRTQNIEEIDRAAQEFEAMFITEMMKPMFEDVMKPDPMFGGGKGEEIFSGMMLTEYGKLMAQTGQLGIADMVKEEMIRMQEDANGQRPVTEE